MRLTDLKPQWENADGSPWDGVQFKRLGFDCPKCGKVRLSIPVPPHPKAWTLTGEDFASLTLHPSIDFKHGDWDEIDPTAIKCNWHGFVRNGEITN